MEFLIMEDIFFKISPRRQFSKTKYTKQMGFFTKRIYILVSLFNGISTFIGYLMPKPRRTVVVLFNP